MAADEAVQKHLNVEGRRRRFDAESRYGGHGGRTLVRGMLPLSSSVGGLRDLHLKVTRPADADGNVLITSADEHLPGINRGEDGEEEYTGGCILTLPDILKSECVAKSTRRHESCHDVIVTTYTLEGIGWMAPGTEEKERLERNRRARLSLARMVPDSAAGLRPRVFCRFRDAPLEKITHPSLLDYHAKLTPSLPFGDGTNNPQQARVLKDDFASCWVAHASEDWSSQYLEVDLGRSCHVAYVSTQGRFPKVKQTDEDTGLRIVSEDGPGYQSWVTSYELSYRRARGHDWIVAAEQLKGNDDMTTELAHPVGEDCRYLRFRPLGCHGQAAMRVGVYGYPIFARQERLLRKDAGPWQKQVADTGSTVQYEVCSLKEAANLRQMRQAFGCCHWACTRCKRNQGCKAWKASRKRRLRGEARGLAAEAAGGLAGPAETAGPEPRPPAPGEGGALQEAGPEPLPCAQRQRSFSDPEPSAAAAACTDESAASVSSLEHLEDPDSDGWVVM